MATDVLVIGSGGREHALVWKLAQSPQIGKLYVAPGNGGTATIAENVALDVMDFAGLVKFAKEKHIDLTVVGPDDPLAGGIVDTFKASGLRAWGPVKEAARIEASKAFAKECMRQAGIPTAAFKTCVSAPEALAYIHTQGVPIVVKASGLALGKGVYVCKTMSEAEAAVDAIMVQRVHKEAGNEVVIEEYLEGQEISVHALSDGKRHILFPSSQDHKRAHDGDEGPNTGGMGVIAPVPWVTTDMLARIDAEVVSRAFGLFKKIGIPYTGLLYPGIMVTRNGPKVLEFNARFGDPETQAYMRLMKNDLLELLEASADGDLSSVNVEWHGGFVVNIVVASGGYPGAYTKGLPITGIKEAERVESVVVFHAGTKKVYGGVVANGGRVLGVSATSDSLKQALERAYEAVSRIHFDGMFYRHDIGAKSV